MGFIHEHKSAFAGDTKKKTTAVRRLSQLECFPFIQCLRTNIESDIVGIFINGKPKLFHYMRICLGLF